ncbi:Beta-fimbriae probable major subunit [Pseudomonas synxantha]|uniref:Beta-fimbriae probable major subunit n=1 Tax=Pseudomonas synxantha TaxID=47883 RepID=A0A3G7UE57_9PSED|nr:DUF1120 domain-containing protein [Pseudomonas synxantha]AZE56899.1 Beta-fimbriae probable major subunit [Pseudomonas synxantha]
MKHTTKNIALVLSLATLVTTSLPVLGAPVDVRVIGSITPAACTPTVGGGGTIDYGHIHPSKLSSTDYTVLPEKTIALSITCDAPAKVAINAINGRPSSAAGAIEGLGGAGTGPIPLGGETGPYVVGLGLTDDGKKIGGYRLMYDIASSTADGVNVANIWRFNFETDVHWLRSSSNLYHRVAPRYTSWSTETARPYLPVAATTFSATIKVHAYLNNTTELDISKPIVLDGLTTLELIYL